VIDTFIGFHQIYKLLNTFINALFSTNSAIYVCKKITFVEKHRLKRIKLAKLAII